MKDPRIDLSPLDPSRDAGRWERMVRSVAALAADGAARRRPGPLALQLATWTRPILAGAAALAVVVWVPAWLRSPRLATAPPAAAADAATRLAAWAASDDAAAPALLAVLGGDDDAR